MKPPISVEELYAEPFAIERHKLIPYLSLEVVLSPDGEVAYAVPSHQEYLIAKAMERHHWTRQELMDACPPAFYCNFMEWLIEQSGGYIPVWERGILDYPITKKQANTLRKLKLAGLFKGTLPKEDKDNA